ncbi:hypothetical protein BVRB_6g136910 [Beta vulgaris subsp. vulgaris]|nr:hypothetical protein BVRB_6g136910 [Beta vulgaris subsp. vulgaris]
MLTMKTSFLSLLLLLTITLTFIHPSTSSSNSNTIFLEPSSRKPPPPPPPPQEPPFHHRYCDSFTLKYPPSICNTQFRQYLMFSPPPPPPSLASEIDPRYGVEKRLVPSGPNPLHN